VPAAISATSSEGEPSVEVGDLLAFRQCHVVIVKDDGLVCLEFHFSL
jgi:hypothetical protein